MQALNLNSESKSKTGRLRIYQENMADYQRKATGHGKYKETVKDENKNCNRNVEGKNDSTKYDSKKYTTSVDSKKEPTKVDNNRDPTKQTQKSAKAKCSHLYVVICDAVSNDVRVAAFLKQRMGNPKTLHFIVTEIMSIAEKNPGCSLVTIELESGNKASIAKHLLHKSNRGNTSKVHCFHEKHEALNEDVKPTVQRRETVTRALKELLEAPEKFLRKHDEKEQMQEARLNEVTKKLQNNRGVSFDIFETLSNERDALKDKLIELQCQKKEFREYMLSIRHKLEDIIEHDKYENELKEIRKALGVECHRLDAALPIYARRGDILTAIKKHQVSVILGETGSGKSTQMVQYLFQAGFGEKGMIACTQPRKIAATSLATHVAKEMASSVGQIVGYQVGLQRKKSAVTSILFMTDHILLNECLSDRTLSKYSCIIIDEAHERSIHTDLLLGLLKQCLETRPDLRVVITSATIDPDIFVEYFGGLDVCPVLRVSGRTFPVEVVWSHHQLTDAQFSDNYEAKALEMAVEIHKNQKVTDGDILVFLTSAVETERCVEKFKARVGEMEAICLQLHGRLSAEEQQKVFTPTPAGKRKVVFSTNSAETSITIDGIKFVVDTGVVKEMRFDPRKNMSSLDVVSVSQSSANQRKGRAGRTSSGTCYRLYSEANYKSMTKCGTPEILRIQVSQAMLKLLELGVEPTSFQYVQSPSRPAMQLALNNLANIGAVDAEGKITELGKWIAKLSVEPRLGLLIKKAIELDIASEGLIIAACCNQSGIFFRAGTQEEKRSADEKKLKFCHSGGDLLTMLSVYREWDCVKETTKGRWCKENSINGKSMKGIRDFVNETRTTLNKDIKLKLKHEFAPAEAADAKVQKLVFNCMTCNLAYYLGHESAGYLIVDRRQRVQVHPSSALLALGSQPQWIVYNRVLKTSADFITDVTPVSEDAINEARADGKIKFDEESLELFRVERVKVFPVGRHVFSQFVGPLHSNRRRVEEEIGSVCSDTVVIVEANKQRGEIILYCTVKNAYIAVDILNDSIQPLPARLLNECREEPIFTRTGENVGVRIILGAGAAVNDVLMPGQYRAMNIKEKPFLQYALSEDELHHVLSAFGPIETLWKTTGRRNENSVFWGKVIFTKEADAVAATRHVTDDEESSFNLVPITFQSQSERSAINNQGYTMKLTWCRRRARGIGFVNLNRPEDLPILLSAGKIVVDGVYVYVTLAKQTANNAKDPADLYMRGLKPDVTEAAISHGLAEALELDPADTVNRFRIKIPRVQAEYSQQTFQRTKNELNRILTSFDAGAFNLHVIEFKETTVFCRAFVKFQNVQDAENAYRRFAENDWHVDGNRIQADMEFKSAIHVHKRVYGLVKVALELLMARYKLSKSTSVHMRELKSGNFTFDLTSTSLAKLAKAKVKFDNIVENEVMESDETTNLLPMFGTDGRQKLQSIEKATWTIIYSEMRQMKIYIQGTPINRCTARQKILGVLDEMKELSEREVTLKGEDNPPGLMKALYLKYGAKFDKLRSESRLSGIQINMRRHEIAICGSEDALAKAMEKINAEKAAIQTQDHVTVDDVAMPDCPVCLCPVEVFDMSRLEFCGHAYCNTCLAMQIKTAITDSELPIRCATEDCNKDLVIRDINNQIKLRTIKQSHLTKAALNSFIRTCNDTYRFCLTPDCQMVYRVTSSGERFQCGLCHVDICTTCHIKYHDGLTCALYKSALADGGDSIVKWIQEDPTNRKRCPKCSLGIEKIDGCNHMPCRCNAHICWKCLKYFDSGQECYGHLAKEHGSFM